MRALTSWVMALTVFAVGVAAEEVTMKLSSPSFLHNQRIPKQCTGEGVDVSPTLKWEGTRLRAVSR